MTSMDGSHSARLRHAAFESDPVPQLVFDSSGALTACNAVAEARFGLTRSDVGRRVADLDMSGRLVELPMAVARALEERRSFAIEDVQWPIGMDVRTLQMVVTPLLDADRSPVGARVSFHDMTDFKAIKLELRQTRQELDTTSGQLQSTNEQLESANEALRATVESLEAANEELQSTNEELQRMNDELQSANQALQAMNEELRNRV